MKSSLIAAAGLFASAQAELHRMKLQKVPLEEQLVCIDAYRSRRSPSKLIAVDS